MQLEPRQELPSKLPQLIVQLQLTIMVGPFTFLPPQPLP